MIRCLTGIRGMSGSVDHGATVNKNGPTMHLTRWLAVAAAAFLLAAGTVMPQAAQAREIVGFSGNYSSGTIVVKTSERKLYYVLGNGKALRYPVGVGRIGKQWSGTAMISGKYLRPAWSPPADVKRDKPWMPNVIPGGHPAKSYGGGRPDVDRRAVCHSRHQQP